MSIISTGPGQTFRPRWLFHSLDLVMLHCQCISSDYISQDHIYLRRCEQGSHLERRRRLCLLSTQPAGFLLCACGLPHILAALLFFLLTLGAKSDSAGTEILAVRAWHLWTRQTVILRQTPANSGLSLHLSDLKHHFHTPSLDASLKFGTISKIGPQKSPHTAPCWTIGKGGHVSECLWKQSVLAISSQTFGPSTPTPPSKVHLGLASPSYCTAILAINETLKGGT